MRGTSAGDVERGSFAEGFGQLVAAESRTDVLLHHGDGARVVAAVGQDDVGMLLRGFDKLVVHGFEHVAIFLNQHFERVTALGDVALDDAKQALVGTGVDKELEVHLFAQVAIVERHDALDDDHFAWLHVDCFLAARAREVGIGGLFDGHAVAKLLNLVGEQRPIEGVGMVEVREFTKFFGHVPLMFVVRVLGDDGYGVGRQTFHDFAHNGGLARPRAARDSDDEHSVCGLVVMRKSTQKKRILEISLFQKALFSCPARVFSSERRGVSPKT